MIKNNYFIENDIVNIILSMRVGYKLCSVSVDSFEKLIKPLPISWNAYYAKNSDTYYVKGKYNGKLCSIHRIIKGVNGQPKSITVDHLDHNGLNNLDFNLKLKTESQNSLNRYSANANGKSGHRNVTYHKLMRQWEAHICVNGKQIRKRFQTIAEAIEYAEYLRKTYIK